MACATADTLIPIDDTDASVIGIDRMLRASFAAGRGLTLTAGIREVGEVLIIHTIFPMDMKVSRHLNPGNIGTALAIIGQCAVNFTSLATDTAGTIDNQKSGRCGPGRHDAFIYFPLCTAEEIQHGSRNRKPGKTLTRNLQELSSRHLTVKKTVLLFL
jgi:hypothetical protein